MKRKSRPTPIVETPSPQVARFSILGQVVEDRPQAPDEIHRIEQTPEFARWRGSLKDLRARTTIAREIGKYARGLATAEHKRDGLHELKIDYGPGYRLYFGKVGTCIILMFGGGTKKDQKQEINERVEQWKEIKRGISQL